MPTRRNFLQHAAAGGVLAAVSAQITAATGNDVRSSVKPLRAHPIPRTDLLASRLAYGAGNLRLDRGGLRLLETICDNGINLFDHADIYGEAPFGEILKRSPGLRNRILIQSKCGLRAGADTQLYLDCTRKHIVSAAEKSLQLMGTDRVDILLLHWPDALMQPEEVAEAFDQLKHDGKVLYFGVSNHSPSQIELLQRYVRQPLVVNQIHLSLEDSYLLAGSLVAVKSYSGRDAYNQTDAPATLDYCRLHQIQPQAWSPLRGSLLRPPAEVSPHLQHAVHVLARIATEKSVAPSAVALAWLLHHPAGITPILGSTNPRHIVENCAAASVSLGREEWYQLLHATLPVQKRTAR